MEGTGRSDLLMPIISATIAGRYAAGHFNEGLYELALSLKSVPFLDHHIPAHLDTCELLVAVPAEWERGRTLRRNAPLPTNRERVLRFTG